MDATKWQPRPPDITNADIWRQIGLDGYGKEVTSAATYSYMWLADEVGHMGLGILLSFGTIAICEHLLGGWFPSPLGAQAAGFLMAAVIVALFERSTYLSSVKQAAGSQFPLQKDLLLKDALVATFYMALGAAMGWALHRDWWVSVPLILAMIGVAFAMAFPWVRQKMIWQKAALPYLNRMADLPREMPDAVAAELWARVEAPQPGDPGAGPHHILVSGPVGSGRTRLACSIGTEHAFRGRAVRYMPFSQLVDGAQSKDLGLHEHGPSNIHYWSWGRAQVLILDDIGPFLEATARPGEGPVAALERLLETLLGPVRDGLALRSTIWMLGPTGGESGSHLALMAAALARFLEAPHPPLTVPLSLPKGAPTASPAGLGVSPESAA
jgi:hypothetical protein